MKITLLAASALLLCGSVNAQVSGNEVIPEEKVGYNSLGQKIITTTPVSFHKTIPVRDLPPVSIESLSPKSEQQDGRRDFNINGYEEAVVIGEETIDPVVQKEMGTRELRAPIVGWNGMGTGGFPPDPTGAANDTYYIQGFNTGIRVYEKDGSVVPGGTFSLSSFWSGSTNMGDPIVMFDRHADRWFISQFQQSPNRILIAISETNDPLGSYYAYSFTLSQFPDYPKYSIWWDAYYMSSNSSHTAIAYEREKMIAGDPGAQMISMALPGMAVQPQGFRAALPADADGPLPPNGTPCYFFNLADDAFSGVSQDEIEVFEMTCNWTNTNASSVVQTMTVPVSNLNSLFSGGWNNISQPGTTQKLDAIMGNLMYRAQHMRWNGYNTILLSHVVNLGSNRAGVRWYELRDSDDGNWTLYQEGTYAPDNVSRWMSSIAMDDWGNIGMGYSISDGTSVYPGLAYTGRLSGDNLGDMSYGEQVAIAGGSSQQGINRFGDYGHLALDPDGKTFWYTGEYHNGGQSRTYVFSFSIYDEANIEDPYYADLNMAAFQNAENLHVKLDGIHNNESIDVEVIAMNGQVVAANNAVLPSAGSIDETLNISNLESGIYFVNVGNVNFRKVEKVYIQN